MKKLLLILVLLVSGNTIGQLADNQRELTARRLGGNSDITWHVFQPGLAGITYLGNYHDLRSEADTYMRITNSGHPTEGDNILHIDGVDYVTTNAYVQSQTRVFLDAELNGGFVRNLTDGVDIPNSNVFTLPVMRTGFPTDFTPGNVDHNTATTSYLQYNCNINDGSDCLERTVEIRRLTLNDFWGLPNSDGLLDATTTNFNTLDEAIAHVSSSSYPRRIAIGQVFTWEALIDGSVVYTSGNWYASGVTTARYSPAASWFSLLESNTGHHGGYQSDYFEWTWGDAVITYSSANGGRWTWNGTPYTSQMAVFNALND